MLVLEIDYLSGTVFAARSGTEGRLDWPPQPDRVFSALVASWGARGRAPREREALEWLEQQEPPRIFASEIERRSTPVVYVPPNDAKTASKSTRDLIPALRTRQPRRFPAGRPLDTVVRMVWATDADAETIASLDALARDTSYVGHSTSLTRCRFTNKALEVAGAPDGEHTPRFRVYEGRFAELEARFERGLRPGPGAVVVPVADKPEQPRSVFSDQWVVFADTGGRAPDLFGFAIVSRKLRDALMSAYQEVSGDPPEWISGHSGNGGAASETHLAIVPLADVGWEYSEGRVMGCALVLPREKVIADVGPAIGRLLARSTSDTAIELHYGGPSPWLLEPTGIPSRESQRSSRWIGLPKSASAAGDLRPARVWASATPIILDRYLKKRDPDERLAEIGDLVSRACENIGLPRPSFVRTAVASNLRGAHAVRPMPGAPAWQRWQLPEKLSGRYLVHATIGFDEPVFGPVLIGAGRYVGLGLCLPVPGGAT